MSRRGADKKPLSRSIKILIACFVALVIFTLIIIVCMAFFDMPEPTTLIMSFFGVFGGVIEGANAILNGLDKRNEGKLARLQLEKGVADCELDNE